MPRATVADRNRMKPANAAALKRPHSFHGSRAPGPNANIVATRRASASVFVKPFLPKGNGAIAHRVSAAGLPTAKPPPGLKGAGENRNRDGRRRSSLRRSMTTRQPKQERRTSGVDAVTGAETENAYLGRVQRAVHELAAENPGVDPDLLMRMAGAKGSESRTQQQIVQIRKKRGKRKKDKSTRRTRIGQMKGKRKGKGKGKGTGKGKGKGKGKGNARETALLPAVVEADDEVEDN